MFKRILFVGLLILITLIAWKQDSNAKTWPPGSKIPADSIIAAIDRGEDIKIDSCEIFGPLIKVGEPKRPDTINSMIQLRHNTFKDIVLFRDCYFSSSVCFSGATFGGDSYFLWCIFSKNADFRGVAFSGDADLMGTTFRRFAYFDGATFNRLALFSSTTIGDSGHASFVKATFTTFASFSRALFSGSASFRNASFGGFCDFSEAEFQKKVDFRLKELKNFYIKWKQLEGHLSYGEAPFVLKFMKYFEVQRQLDDADGAYLFLKDQERREKSWLRRYFEYWVLQLPCGYGVRPWNILFLSIGIILIFTLFYTKSNGIKEIEKEFGNPRRRRIRQGACRSFRKRWRYAFYFSFQTFIIGVVPDWYPTDEFLINTRKIKLFKFRTLSMIEGALGWVLLVLFVVTLTRKFIR